MRRIVIGVMGAGEGALENDLINAEALGELVAREGWTLLTGGRPEGVMGAANRGAKKVEGSLTVGILPQSSGGASQDVDVAIFTGMGSARNNINVLSSDVIVACGRGGAGTLSEIALAIKADRPIIVVAADESSKAFLAVLSGAIRFADSVERVPTLIREILSLPR